MNKTHNVRCLLTDFPKAFDSINHLILLQKLKVINIPPSIFNQTANFLSGREQYVKLVAYYQEFRTRIWFGASSFRYIQGSCDKNHLCKYKKCMLMT